MSYSPLHTLMRCCSTPEHRKQLVKLDNRLSYSVLKLPTVKLFFT